MTTVGLPQSLISTLPGSYYTDPTIFAMEQSQIFEAMWFCAVRSADLDNGADSAVFSHVVYRRYVVDSPRPGIAYALNAQ